MTVAGSWVKHRQMITKTLSTLDPSCECTTVTTPPVPPYSNTNNSIISTWAFGSAAAWPSQPASQLCVTPGPRRRLQPVREKWTKCSSRWRALMNMPFRGRQQ